MDIDIKTPIIDEFTNIYKEPLLQKEWFGHEFKEGSIVVDYRDFYGYRLYPKFSEKFKPFYIFFAPFFLIEPLIIAFFWIYGLYIEFTLSKLLTYIIITIIYIGLSIYLGCPKIIKKNIQQVGINNNIQSKGTNIEFVESNIKISSILYRSLAKYWWLYILYSLILFFNIVTIEILLFYLVIISIEFFHALIFSITLYIVLRIKYNKLVFIIGDIKNLKKNISQISRNIKKIRKTVKITEINNGLGILIGETIILISELFVLIGKKGYINKDKIIQLKEEILGQMLSIFDYIDNIKLNENYISNPELEKRFNDERTKLIAL